MTDRSFLIVGLGNPGPTYSLTRHNVGFWCVDDLADRLGTDFKAERRRKADIATATLRNGADPSTTQLRLIKPQTFMNNSGLAVAQLAKFYQLEPSQIVVVHDELDLDPGRLRVKLGGGDNGHNGLKSIRSHLGTGDFVRVRIGIGRPPGRQPTADYVLARVKPKEYDELLVSAAVAGDAVECYVRDGLVATQNQFNN